MKTEQELKQRLEYLKGYKDALKEYQDKSTTIMIDTDIAQHEGQIDAIEWVLEVNNDNK